MPAEYKWTFNGIKVRKLTENSLTDAVISYEWRRGLQDGTLYVDTYGSLSLKNPDPKNFTKYEDLTKEDFVTWTVDTLTKETVDRYDVSLANQMKDLKSPTEVIKGAPWELTLVATPVPEIAPAPVTGATGATGASSSSTGATGSTGSVTTPVV